MSYENMLVCMVLDLECIFGLQKGYVNFNSNIHDLAKPPIFSSSEDIDLWYTVQMKVDSIGKEMHLPAVNPSDPRQNGRHFADDIFRCIFVNEKFCILIKISLKFIPKGVIDNNPALV